MSMSEYEKENHSEWDNLFPSTLEPGLPADFSEEDALFAQELGTLFSAPDEILPPYYAQTLLQAEDPRYSVIDNAFAQRTSARVFRSLKLRRRLFRRRRSALSILGDTLREVITRKSLVAWAAVLMLIMMLTVAFTAPSFEQGVSMLLRGSTSGVIKVKSYPNHVHHNYPVLSSYNIYPVQAPLLTTERVLHFNIYWPRWIPANYALDSINVYEDPGNTWADGPIIDLVYDVDTSRINPKGTGQIVIREFKPLEQVLQVVQDGNAYPISPDRYGDNPRAIYVDGQWLTTGKMPAQIWGRGGRSEVIYQHNGIVFWIAGDQRDGIDRKALWNLAQSLQIIPLTPHSLMKNVMVTILLPDNSNLAGGPFTNDILFVASLDGTDGQYYMTMSAYISGKLSSTIIGRGR